MVASRQFNQLKQASASRLGYGRIMIHIAVHLAEGRLLNWNTVTYVTSATDSIERVKGKKK
jgi:hypothetical protein